MSGPALTSAASARRRLRTHVAPPRPGPREGRTRRMVAAGAAGAAVAGTAAGGIGLGLIAGCAVPVAAALIAPVAATRPRAARDRALVALLQRMVGALRSGAGLAQAFEAAAIAASPVLRDPAVVAIAARSVGLPRALDEWAARTPSQSEALAARALAMASDLGGPGAAAIDGVLDTITTRMAVAAEAQALGAQARLSALIIAAAPAVFAVVAGGLDPRAAAFLVRTGVGQACLAAGLALDALGAAWMARIARVAA